MVSNDSEASLTSMPRIVRKDAPMMSLSITRLSWLKPSRLACIPAAS